MMNVEAIRARAEAATPGKWEYDGSGCVGIYDEKGFHKLDICECDDIWTENAESNGEFIAHAKEDIEALLAELDAVKAERDHYKQIEVDGRLIELPCKVGDTICIDKAGAVKVDSIDIWVQYCGSKDGTCGHRIFTTKNLQKKFVKFKNLTREEAEQAL